MALCWDDCGRLWVAENRDDEIRKNRLRQTQLARLQDRTTPVEPRPDILRVLAAFAAADKAQAILTLSG